MKKAILRQSKSGVASLYVVIFATILFGVITLSFIRIMVSESSQTSDSDLSESAYDAAMAGVEDAKVAVNRYYTCKDNNWVGTGCSEIKDNLFNKECGHLKDVLYNEGEGEVAIQESSDGENGANQAYTCVILSNETSNYVFTLDSSTRVQVVPIATNNDAKETSTIQFSWFTESNGTAFSHMEDNPNNYFKKGIEATIPPAIGLSLITIGENIDLSEFAKSNSERFTTVVMLPNNTEPAQGVTILDRGGEITAQQLKDAANPASENAPFGIKCSLPGEEGEYACQVKLNVADLMQDNGNAYLIASMPYGAVSTDCEVEKLDENGDTVPFKDVQIKVDSTGRAFDLYRRVETRLSPAASSYPFPQFELETGNGGDDSGKAGINKHFWITTNCWGDGCKNNSK